VDRAVALLATAERPLVVLGKGAAYARADDEIRRFVETTGLPFLPMSMAKGLLPDDHPLSAGAARSLALRRADVVMLVGARLNWLLGHGEPPQWSPDARFIQVDIEPAEFDGNRPIAAPLVGDVGSVMQLLLERTRPGQIRVAPWRAELAARSVQNAERMAARLAADPRPMQFDGALRAVRDIVRRRPDVYVVNEGANTLDVARNVIDMRVPRHRLDSGTWGVMGVGPGYAIAAAVESRGAPVIAVEGDSAFGFGGMELETICRYRLPVVVVILNNGGVYRGDEVNHASADPAPTALSPGARHELLIEAFGGRGYHVAAPTELTAALNDALAGGGPALIDCVIDPAVGSESGHLTHLNPKGAVHV
jgi:oxalyl-CoA decarboxylase